MAADDLDDVLVAKGKGLGESSTEAAPPAMLSGDTQRGEIANDASTDLASVTDTPAARKSAPARPLLWRVEGARSTIYLFGTLHIVAADAEWRDARVLQAFDTADALIIESEWAGDSAQALSPLIRELGLYPPGKQLGDVLNDEAEARLAEVVESIGVPLVVVQKMRPWLANLVLTVELLGEVGGDSSLGVENRLVDMATSAGKPVRHLESAETQIRKLAAADEETAVRAIEASLSRPNSGPELFARFQDAWLAGDAEALAALLAESFAADPEAYARLVKTRNETWVETIDTILLEESGVFLVAVGVGHVVGPHALNVLLEERGWRVTPAPDVSIGDLSLRN